MTNDNIDEIISDIEDAIAEYHQTTVGYINKKWKPPAPKGTHWSNGDLFLDAATIKLESLKTQPPAVDPAVIVSAIGSDTAGDGSILKPFATLAKAQKAMRSGSPPNCLVRGGDYKLPIAEQLSGSLFGLRCTQQDTGQTYKPFENEKVAFDCSALTVGLAADGASNVTFEGFELFGAKWIGIGIHGAGNGLQMFPQVVPQAKGNTVRHCHVHHCSLDTSVVYGYGAAPIFGRGDIPGTTIDHNAVHDAPTTGITASASDAAGPHYIDDLIIIGNAVYTVAQGVVDAGGIYAQDVTATSTGIGIYDNFVRDVAAKQLGSHGRYTGCPLYLDDGTSNVEVIGNIAAGLFDIACGVHGGKNVLWQNNLIDACALASENGPIIMRMQPSGNPPRTDMSNVRFQHNIVIAKTLQWPLHFWHDISVASKATYLGNLYHSYGSAVITPSPVETRSVAVAGDVNPTWADPLLSGILYELAANSPAYAAPVSFKPLKRNWGPPGYVIPAGTAPSYA